MKFAVISDIHSNWQALEAVMADFPTLDEVICLGDVVGYGGDPNKCLDHVRDKRWPTLVGNHDRACTDVDILEWFNEDAARAIEWTVAHLGKNRLDWLQSLPDCDQIGDEIVLVHGSPRDHIYEYILDGPTADATFIGRLIDRLLVYVGFFQHQTTIALVVIAYAAVEGTEGIGLALRRRWAEYLIVVATGLFIPYEVWEVVHKVTLFRVGGLLLNVAIVVYLAYRKRLFVGV